MLEIVTLVVANGLLKQNLHHALWLQKILQIFCRKLKNSKFEVKREVQN